MIQKKHVSDILHSSPFKPALLVVELERVPDPAQRPGPEEKVAVDKSNTRYYPGPNLGHVRELYTELDKARESVGYTRLEKSSKNFKDSLGSRHFSQLTVLSSGPKTRYGSIPEILSPFQLLSGWPLYRRTETKGQLTKKNNDQRS